MYTALYISNISSWKRRGMTTIDTLYDGSRIRSFADLQQLYHLPAPDFLT